MKKIMIETTPNKQAQLGELLHFVREHSAYYQRLYKEVDTTTTHIEDYPVLSLDEFWACNTIDNNQVLTSVPAGGITFKSGGSSGNPKYSVYSNEDWDSFTQAFGKGLHRSGLHTGQQVGNLFYAGRLYASFLFITRSIEQAQVGMCYPIAGVEAEEIISIWRQFNLNTLAGVPTTLMNILAQLNEKDLKDLSLSYFLYGGEPMFSDQVDELQRKFPGCQVRSIGIAGVDYGEIGWACPSGELGVHHSFDDTTILEIVDDEGQVIHEVGAVGRLVVTNLKRRLMPIIRYPVGDQGVWLDAPETPWRRFKVLGRSHDGARIGPMTVYIEDIINVIAKINLSLSPQRIINFQIVVNHFDQKDCCTLCLVTDIPIEKSTDFNENIRHVLYEERSMFKDLIQENIVHPLEVSWISPRQLITNTRTGKVLRVVDQRHHSK